LKREKKSSVIQKPVYVKKRKHRFSFLSIIALTVFAIIVIIFTGYLLFENPTRYLPPRHQQVTFNGNIYMARFGTGDVDVSAISPDGQFLAYVVKQKDTYSIMVRDLTGSQPIEIYGGFESLDKISWSPDGTRILFHGYMVNKENEPFGQNYILPRFGGKSQNLPPSAYVAWSPDGTQFAGTWTAGPWTEKKFHPLYFFNAATGDTVNEIRLHGFQRFVALDWSPPRDRIVFLTADEKWNQFTIWTVKSDGTQQQKIVEEIGRYYSPRWSGDGEAIYYLRQNGMTTDLMKIKISYSDGTQIGEPQILQNGLHSTGFTISRDTKKLAYTKIENYSNLWSATVVGEGESQQISTAKLTHGTSRHMWPAFSPDGNKISFISQQQVFVMNSDGGNIHQLTFLQSECKVPCWSPDGNELAFIADEKVWQIPTEGGKPSQFKETDVIRELSWSPGNKILYLRPENQNYHLLDPQTGSEMPLVSNDSVGFMIHARRSPDGKNVAVVWQRVDGQYLWIISMEDSSQIRIQNQDPWTTLAPLQWSADGKWIYLVRSGKPQLDILTLSVNGGEPQRIFTLPFESLYSENGLGPDAISLTPDGSRFVCSVRESISDIWMIDNFDPEIE
jgi:Tol biopolymer transport system component